MPEHIRVWRTAGFRGIELQRGVGVTRRVPPHWHDEYHLCLVHGGAGELFYRGVHHANPPWSLFIVHPGEIHSNRATVERGCDFRTINAAPEILEQAAEAVGYQRRALPFFPRAVVLDHEALLRFQRLHEALEQPAARLERDASLLETFAHLVRRYAQDAPTPGKDGREPQGVRRVRDYLEASFADEIPLQRLAAIARLSPYYLNRAFRRAFGLPPHAFQTQLRLAEARKLLRQGELPATVAAETGFADQSHLTRRFKTVVGVTPGAYRKNVQDRNPCARYFRGMKTTALFLSISAAAAVHADDFSKDRWRFRGPTANVEEKLGRSSLFLRGTHAYLNDVAFADGTIDVDVAVPRQRNFVGVLFRVASEGSQERVYLRPHKSGLDDALQYEANFDQSSTWQLFSAPGYMRPADIPWEQWFHVRLVISGSQATVFLHGSETPALVVKDLKRGYARGGIGLYAGSGGAWFSNLRYQPAKESAPPAPRPPPSFAKGVVQAWELSESFDADSALPEALPAIANWDRVAAEEPGLLVIDRYRKSSGTLPPSFDFEKRLGPAKGRRVVYARAVVQSDREQVKRLSFGYSDEVCVFVNGRIVFTGRSAFRFRDPGFMGVLDVDDDAVYLPLRKGRNELVMAVAEYFGGWGVAARFDDPSGLTVR